MLTDDQQAALEAAWRPARAAGVVGDASLDELYEHAAGYVSAACSAFSIDPARFDGRVIDIGTGAGIPGLFLALLWPHATVTLVDAMDRRLDHARRGARALGVQDRVSVLHARGEALAHDPAHRGQYDVAVSRLLAEPVDATELLAGFLAPRGALVASTAQDQLDVWETLPWPGVGLGAASVSTHSAASHHYATVRHVGEVPAVLPRPLKARRRRPLPTCFT